MQLLSLPLALWRLRLPWADLAPNQKTRKSEISGGVSEISGEISEIPGEIWKISGEKKRRKSDEKVTPQSGRHFFKNSTFMKQKLRFSEKWQKSDAGFVIFWFVGKLCHGSARPHQREFWVYCGWGIRTWKFIEMGWSALNQLWIWPHRHHVSDESLGDFIRSIFLLSYGEMHGGETSFVLAQSLE